MWRCASCGEDIDDRFAACWSCGTHADGTPSAHHQREDRVVLCYVCDAEGEFDEVDVVHVALGCLFLAREDEVPQKWQRAREARRPPTDWFN